LLIFLLAAAFGCQAQEPPLSPAAAAFKKEIKDCIARLSQPLGEPLVQGNLAAIQDILKKNEPDAVKLCRMCPFRIGVLDVQGDTLTVYPFKKDAMGSFSHYNVVMQALKTQKVTQDRMFLQDGSKLYIVCTPIKHQDQVVGVLAVGLSSEEAEKRWGITEKEFLALDFNR
jgi:hypothetical protein